MVTVSKASLKETKDWSVAQWHKLDVPHYGRPIDWKEKKFRFKAVENGKIVGLISGKHESGALYIGNIITGEGQRGKGIGTMLMKEAEEFGRKLGAHRIWLMTGKTWSENEFYRKLGFKIAGTLPDFHFRSDFVIYTKAIGT